MRVGLCLLALACGGDRPRDEDEDGWFTPEDCNDRDPRVNPDARDACVDGRMRDRDCQPGFRGNDDPMASGGVVDVDGDGWGAWTSWAICGTPPGPSSSREGDCDDRDPGVNPDAAELCGDGVDQDCDAEADEGCDA